MPHGVPSMDDMKRMADKKADPLLTKLKGRSEQRNPMNQIGIVYRSAHQFKEAQKYFEQSLQIDPKNADVRADMAACMFYRGRCRRSSGATRQGPHIRSKHAGALMNIGMIKWQAKNGAVPGAVASWEKLLKLNPDFPQKAQVQEMITQAKQSLKKDGRRANTLPRRKPVKIGPIEISE